MPQGLGLGAATPEAPEERLRVDQTELPLLKWSCTKSAMLRDQSGFLITTAGTSKSSRKNADSSERPVRPALAYTAVD